ncbi:MAG: glycosyltransferase [Magnetococcus sp. WYHC-3]
MNIPESEGDSLTSVAPPAGPQRGGELPPLDPHARGPLVSLITVCRNAVQDLPVTLASVAAQDWPWREYLVIDGASRDGSVALLQRSCPPVDLWISEPDAGIADAFNKGLARCRGQWILLVNAGDWLSPGELTLAMQSVARNPEGVDFLFGDLIRHDATGKPRYRAAGDPDYASKIFWRMPDLNHPTVIFHRRIWETIGGFDPRWRLAMDYDWLLRAHRAGFRGRYLPDLVGHMPLGGVSQRYRRQALGECRRIALAQGGARLRVEATYWRRLLEGEARAWAESCLPAAWVLRLRQWCNPHCRGEPT